MAAASVQRAGTVDRGRARTGRRVRDEFQRQLSGVVAEETYVQDVREPIPSGTLPRAPMRGGPMHRELKSDLLLVKPDGADRWIQFRDVFEVDGKPIRDRSERLMKLFVEPTVVDGRSQPNRSSARARATTSATSCATSTSPVFALLILDPRNRGHFKFSRADKGAPSIAVGRDLAVPDGTWVVRYRGNGARHADRHEPTGAICRRAAASGSTRTPAAC